MSAALLSLFRKDPQAQSVLEAAQKHSWGRLRAHWIRKHASRKLRGPAWADLEAIRIFYANCPRGHHVDHIIPLRGKHVSGLHVLENLQYLPALENIRKGNRHAH